MAGRQLTRQGVSTRTRWWPVVALVLMVLGAASTYYGAYVGNDWLPVGGFALLVCAVVCAILSITDDR